jgi:hypothetical protein
MGLLSFFGLVTTEKDLGPECPFSRQEWLQIPRKLSKPQCGCITARLHFGKILLLFQEHIILSGLY